MRNDPNRSYVSVPLRNLQGEAQLGSPTLNAPTGLALRCGMGFMRSRSIEVRNALPNKYLRWCRVIKRSPGAALTAEGCQAHGR